MTVSRRCTRGAFTLVELLVVIGIIAVLIGILLPALQSARRQANTVKCSAALQEIGRCVQMYVGDNRGWMIPARAGQAPGNAPTAYNLAETDQYAAQNPSLTGTAWWYAFLSKYVTRNKGGVDGSAGAPNSQGFTHTIIWGCPEYRPHKNAQPTADEFSRVYPGYGLNAWPTYTASFPASGVNFPPQVNGRDVESVIQATSTGVWDPPSIGTWFKFSQYRNADQRCMISEADDWELQSKAGTVPLQAQKAWTYKEAADPNNAIDCYRHGRYPSIIGSNYSTVGGKVGYNILYCDGHVVLTTTREEAYRSLRMRYPG